MNQKCQDFRYKQSEFTYPRPQSNLIKKSVRIFKKKKLDHHFHIYNMCIKNTNKRKKIFVSLSNHTVYKYYNI